MTINLQRDLDNIVKWSDRWQMSFNPTKFSVLRVTRKRNPLQHQYTMMDVALAEVKHHPYLGVELSDDLTWATHIAKITGKPNRSLNTIHMNLYDCLHKVKETAYKSFVRPNLEYASSVWDPHLKKEITGLEKVQRRASHFVTAEYSREKGVTNMLSELQWPTLKQCHFVTHQNLLWKAVNNQVAVSIPPHIKPSESQSRGHNHTFINIIARRDNYKYSFFPKTIHCWNLLLPTCCNCA